MFRKVFFCLCLCLCSFSYSYSQNEKTDEFKIDSWYVQLSAGYAFYDFEKDASALNDYETKMSLASNVDFFLTLSPRFLLGAGSYHFWFWGNCGAGCESGVVGNILGIKAEYFFDRIEKGFFVNAMAGLSFLHNCRDTLGPNVGFMFGGGYAFPLSKGISLLIGFNLMYHSTKTEREHDVVKALDFNVGILF